MRLLLLRHAKAEAPRPGLDDHNRALASRGQDAARAMGRFLESAGIVPDRAIVSTAVRTRQTWALVADAFHRPLQAHFEEDIYEAAPQALLEVARHWGGTSPVLMMVGHNPGFHRLATALAGNGAPDALALLAGGMPTGSVAVLDSAIAAWSELKPGAATLAALHTPATIGAAAHDD